MTIRVGRRRGGKAYMPSNTNMHARANKQLEAHAAAQAIKHTESLKVDGPNFAFWHKTHGSIPCSCSAKRSPLQLHAHTTPGEKNATNSSLVGQLEKGVRGRLKGTERPNVTGYFDSDGVAQTSLEKITGSNAKKVATTGSFEEDEDDILGSFDVETPGESLMDFDDPFNLFGNKLIECPICFGETFQNSWQLHNGLRMILDTSNAYAFDSKACTIDSSASGPFKILASKQGEIYWTCKLPMYFNEVIRVVLYNGIEVIDKEQYELTYITEDNSVTGDVDTVDLMDLNGVDSKVTVLWKNKAEIELTVTHIEILLTFAPFDFCQLPEVEMAYEAQFTDWSVSVNAELPAGLNISEGDYLCDTKYKRVWKINSINRRITAGGVQFGTSADLRVLHSFERMFGVLEIF